MEKNVHNMNYRERLEDLQDHYIGAYKARRRKEYRRRRKEYRRRRGDDRGLPGRPSFVPGSEAERAYLEGRY